MAKALGIDYGKARIGLSISDDSQTIASAFKTLHKKDEQKALSHITDIVLKDNISTIVIGLPLGLDGNKTEMSDIINTFATKLEVLLQTHGISPTIILWNESLTSFEAYGNLKQKGFKKFRIQEHLDSEAARIILQEFLDNKELQ